MAGRKTNKGRWALSAAVVGTIGVAAQADWIPTTGGPHDYDALANWDASIINGRFTSVLTADQTVFFDSGATAPISTGWFFGFGGERNLVLKSDGSGDRTLVLSGDVSMDSVAGDRTVSVGLAGGSGANGHRLGLSLDGSRSFTVASTDMLVFQNTLGNNGATIGSIAKWGAGTLALSGSNTFSGGITVHEGAVQIASETGLGAASGIATFKNGTTLRYFNTTSNNGATTTRVFNFDGATATIDVENRQFLLGSTTANVIQGTANITKTGGNASADYAGTARGLLSLGSSNSNFQGNWTLGANTSTSGGVLEVKNVNALGSGTLTIRSGEFAHAINNGTVANDIIIALGASNSSSTPAILGAAGGNNGSATFGGNITANGDFIVALRSFHTLGQGNSITFSKPISGAGEMAVVVGTSSTTQTLTLGANNSNWSGGIIVPARANLSVKAENALGSGTVDINGGKITLGSGIAAAPTYYVAGTGQVNLADASVMDLQSGNNFTYGTGTIAVDPGATASLTTASGNGRTQTFATNGLHLGAGTTGAHLAITANGNSTFSTGDVVTLFGESSVNVGGNGLVNFARGIAGSGEFTKLGSGTLALGASVNATTVNTNVGTAALSGNGSSYTGGTNVGAGVLRLGVTNALPDTVLRIASGATVDFSVSGQSITTAAFDQRVAGLADYNGGGGTIYANSTSATLGAKTLTLDGSGTYAFSGTIADRLASVGSNSTLNLVKSGSGLQTLSGTNTYTGTTEVTGGVLRIDGSLASTAVIVSGGTLSGSGHIAGSVSIGSGGHLAAGNSVDTLETGALTLGAGSVSDIEFNALANDRVDVAGDLTLTAGWGVNFFVENSAEAWTTDGTYTLLDYTGTLAGSGVAEANLGAAFLQSLPNDKVYTIFNDAGETAVKLSIATVPEPVSLGFLGLMATGLLSRRRRAQAH